jgi:hypothetical protein
MVSLMHSFKHSNMGQLGKWCHILIHVLVQMIKTTHLSLKCNKWFIKKHFFELHIMVRAFLTPWFIMLVCVWDTCMPQHFNCLALCTHSVYVWGKLIFIYFLRYTSDRWLNDYEAVRKIHNSKGWLIRRKLPVITYYCWGLPCTIN